MTSKKLDEQVKADISSIYDFADALNTKATNIANRYFEEKDANEKIRIAKHIHELSNNLEKVKWI